MSFRKWQRQCAARRRRIHLISAVLGRYLSRCSLSHLSHARATSLRRSAKLPTGAEVVIPNARYTSFESYISGNQGNQGTKM